MDDMRYTTPLITFNSQEYALGNKLTKTEYEFR